MSEKIYSTGQETQTPMGTIREYETNPRPRYYSAHTVDAVPTFDANGNDYEIAEGSRCLLRVCGDEAILTDVETGAVAHLPANDLATFAAIDHEVR